MYTSDAVILRTRIETRLETITALRPNREGARVETVTDLRPNRKEVRLDTGTDLRLP